MKISSLLSSKRQDVITIAPDELLSDAIAMLREHNIGALIVIGAEGNVLGIISERDIIRALGSPEGLPSTVSEVMTRNVVIAMPEDDLISVAHTMTEKRFRHMPIIDRGKLIGIVSIGDVLKAQRDQYLGEIDTLETQIMADE